MFEQARLKLTLQYVSIIMLVSLLFSGAVYRILTLEIRRSFRVRPRNGEVFRIPSVNGDSDTVLFFNPFIQTPSLSANDLELYMDIKQRLFIELIFVNGGVFIFSSIAAYLLAGRTLGPIERMVDEQKRFIADASHELRTPLTALKTEIEVALRDKKLGIKEARKLLGSNIEEVDKINSLANYLLSLNTYQNKLKLERTELSLRAVVDDALKNVSKKAQSKNITIQLQVEDQKFGAHRLSIIELLTILLDNAIKYSHENGRIILRAKRSGKHTQFEVKDFGIGIKSGDIPYIFNRFYRADTSRSKKQIDGYGLGLSIAKNIVELYGGSIEVVSELSKGSTFTVTL